MSGAADLPRGSMTVRQVAARIADRFDCVCSSAPGWVSSHSDLRLEHWCGRGQETFRDLALMHAQLRLDAEAQYYGGNVAALVEQWRALAPERRAVLIERIPRGWADLDLAAALLRALGANDTRNEKL